METGPSVALFLILGIVLLVLFCLVAKYQQYRMAKKAQAQGQAYSQVDQITHNSEDDIQGQYENFLEKRKLDKQYQAQKMAKKQKGEDYMFETTELDSPMKNNTDPIYGVSLLRRRLDGQVTPMKDNGDQQQTGRSLYSNKSFRPQRLHTDRSSVPSDRRFTPSSSNTPEQPLTKHQFVSKLITYNQQGIIIMDCGVQSLTRTNGKIREKYMINTIKLAPTDNGFADSLQAFGFELKNYGCMKYKIMTQIPYMLDNHEYAISTLKVSEAKEEIDFSEYYMLKDKLQTALQ